MRQNKIPKQKDSIQKFGVKKQKRGPFSQDWSDEHNYLFPPIQVIPKILRHFLSCDKVIKAILIFPYWSPVIFWSLTIEVNETLSIFIHILQSLAIQYIS